MQLTYRGVRYSNRPAHEIATTEHDTVYRGVHYRLRPTSAQRVQAPQRLVYRGVPYITGCAPLPF